ncbi:MAG TPA: condensation domain-containing protein, partial [Dongiaceae bacterium]|nr:condensation domain-containing protein [Dongiaceae bacterium]
MTSTHNITLLLQPHFEQGLELWLENGMLRFKAPKEVLTPALMSLLKQNKEAILTWLQSEQNKSAEPTIVDEYPLAYTQGAIWMLYRFAPNSPAYNTTFACVLNGAVNETAVRQAFHALLIRHPVLRSTFTDTDKGPRQQVWDHIAMPLHFVDGSQWNEDQLDAQLNQEADAPFDLQKEPCLRVKIIRNSVRGDVLIATIQHVGADLWALLIVAKDIKEYYQRAAKGEVLSLEPPTINYRQHVEWQQQFLASERGRKERRFWQRALHNAPMTVSLPTDFPRPPVLLMQSKVIKQDVSGDQYRAIRQFCKSHSITPFVFVQSALQLLVHQRTGARDFLIGTPTMGRSRKGMDQVVGDFANPVVLRARIQPELLLPQLFQQVKRNLLAAMEHQEYPFPAVVQDSNPPRDSSRTPLFQLMFVWHQGNLEMAQDDWIKTILPMSGPRGAPYDVMLAVSDLGDRFELNWTYQTSLYRADTVTRMGEQVQRLLQQFLQIDASATVAGVLSQAAADANTDRLLPQPQRQPEVEAGILTKRPELAHQEFCVVRQTLVSDTFNSANSAGTTELQRLFVGCADPSQRFDLQLRLQSANLPVDDVVLYPQLPRTESGDFDLTQLAQRPHLDQALIQARLQEAGYATGDLLALRTLTHRPTWDDEELAPAKKSGALRPALRNLDISARPDAWAVGEPLPPHAVTSTHLFEALQKTAQRYPDRGLTLLDIDLQQTHYSYAQLVEDAHITAAGFQRASIGPGAIVLLQMRFNRRFFAVWWGAVLAGIRPLNVATPEQYNQRNGVAQKLYNVAHNFAELTVVADRERVEATQTWLGESKQVIDADALLEHNERFEWQSLSNDPVAFLQLTSGSTGTPKAIQITHRGILHHIASSAIHNHYSNDDISLNWLPFDHVVPILTTHVKDCVMGIRQVQLTTTSVLNDPLLWLKAMADFRVTYSWAPNFAYQRVVDALQQTSQLPELDLSCVNILMNAGEQVLAPVVKAFHAACAPFGLKANAVQPAFGMAEACTCMTYNNESDHLLSVHFNNTLDPTVCDIAPAEQATHGFVDLGPVTPGIEIRITNDKNELVKEGVIGRLQIRGPVVTPGYLNNPEANAEAFVGEDWFNSGDLGFMWNKRLILTGREKEMIVVRGANYYCFELEQVAANIAGVVPTFVAATGVALEDGSNSDALVLFYVSDNTQDATQL